MRGGGGGAEGRKDIECLAIFAVAKQNRTVSGKYLLLDSFDALLTCDATSEQLNMQVLQLLQQIITSVQCSLTKFLSGLFVPSSYGQNRKEKKELEEYVLDPITDF